MNATEIRLTGGCQCGAVRYAIAEPLIQPSICHCRMCQKAFGSIFAPLVGTRDFVLTRGALAIFKSSDVVERGFCRDCGTPLSFRYLPDGEMNVSIGSLDDPSIARPITQFGLESRIAWVGELDDLPGTVTEEEEPADRYAEIAATNHQHPDHDTAVWPPAGSRSRGQGSPIDG
jgi:hypothetical protein